MDKNNTSKNYSDEEIYSIIKETIGSLLMIDPETIKKNSTLVGDLEMESLTFVDFLFQLEQAFHIELPRYNVVQRFIFKYGREKFINDDDTLTPETKILLKVSFPETISLHNNITAENVPNLATVQSYIAIVKRALEIANWRPEYCNSCNSPDVVSVNKTTIDNAEYEAKRGPLFQCTSCKLYMPAPDFDEELARKIGNEIGL